MQAQLRRTLAMLCALVTLLMTHTGAAPSHHRLSQLKPPRENKLSPSPRSVSLPSVRPESAAADGE